MVLHLQERPLHLEPSQVHKGKNVSLGEILKAPLSIRGYLISAIGPFVVGKLFALQVVRETLKQKDPKRPVSYEVKTYSLPQFTHPNTRIT